MGNIEKGRPTHKVKLSFFVWFKGRIPSIPTKGVFRLQFLCFSEDYFLCFLSSQILPSSSSSYCFRFFFHPTLSPSPLSRSWSETPSVPSSPTLVSVLPLSVFVADIFVVAVVLSLFHSINFACTNRIASTTLPDRAHLHRFSSLIPWPQNCNKLPPEKRRRFNSSAGCFFYSFAASEMVI